MRRRLCVVRGVPNYHQTRIGVRLGRREAGESGTWEYNDLVELLEAEAAKQTKNFLSFIFAFRRGVRGEPEKMARKFLGLPRASPRARARRVPA